MLNRVVPKLPGSRWDTRQSRTRVDADWPRLGIYCRRRHDLHLIGSFELSADVLEQREERYWGWTTNYLTGDSYLISLNRTSGSGRPQQIINDAPRDFEAESTRRASAIEAVSRGDFDTASEISDQLDLAASELRLRIPLVCPPCGLSRIFRSDTLQPVIEKFAQLGIPEIGVHEFVARVDRRAR